MSEDPFAYQVDRLTHRHRHRHTAGLVAEVTLQRWLTMRRRYSDPFDADIFERIDAALERLPASREDVGRTGSDTPGDRRPTAAVRGPARRGRAVLRPVSRSA